MLRRCAYVTVALAGLAMLAAGVVLAAGGTTPAKNNLFQLVPHDALAFAAINHLDKTDARLQQFSQHVQTPIPSLVALLKEKSGIDKGLDESGAAGIVVLPGSDPEARPAGIALVPVTDYAKFLEGLDAKPGEKITEVKIADHDMLAGNRGGYAVIGMSADREAIEKVLDAKRSILDEQPAVASWLQDNDIVAMATNAGIKKASHAFQAWAEQMNAMMARFRQPGQPNVSPFDMYVGFFQAMEKTVKVIGIAERIDPQGNLRVATRTQFFPDSGPAKSLAAIRALEQNPLQGLPGGPFVIAGGGSWTDAMMRGGAIVQSDAMKKMYREIYSLDEQQIDEMMTILKEQTPKGANAFSAVLSPGSADEPLLGGLAGIYRVDNASKFLEAYEKYAQALQGFQKKVNSPKLKIAPTVKKTEIGGRPALEMETEVDFSQGGQMQPGAEEKMAKLIGPGGKMQMVFVAVDEHTVTVSLAGEKHAQRVMDSVKQPTGGLVADADVAKTAALLPKGAQWVIYLSPSGVTAMIDRLNFATFLPMFLPPNIPLFPASPPIGIAITAAPAELQTEIVLSVPMLGAVGKYVNKIRNPGGDDESK